MLNLKAGKYTTTKPLCQGNEEIKTMDTVNHPIRNKVAEANIFDLDLAKLIPGKEEIIFDLSDFLEEGFILREKDFRNALKEHDWRKYENAYVMVTCSTDAILPQWAFMLVASHLSLAAAVVSGDRNDLYRHLWDQNINKLDEKEFQDLRVMVKGCTNLPEMEYAFVRLVTKLQPLVKSIMYGEICSSVPVYKKK